MKLEQLLYFAKVVEKSSFRAASDEIFITQQALSTSIKNLETELDCKLLERTKKGVCLTEDGKYVYEKAKYILSSCDEVKNHFKNRVSTALSGKISVATTTSLKEFVLPPVVTFFLRMYPDVKLDCILKENNEVIGMVNDNIVDLGLIAYMEVEKKYVTPLPHNISFIPLYQVLYDCVVSKNSPLAVYKTISMATVRKQKIILNTYSNIDMKNNIIYQLLHYYSSGFQFIEADSAMLYYQLIKDGFGVGIVPRKSFIQKEGLVTISLTDNIKSYGGVILNTNKEEDSLVNFFIDKIFELNSFTL